MSVNRIDAAVDRFGEVDAKDPWTETRGRLQVLYSVTAMLEIKLALVTMAGQVLIIV
jgi:hypothetical protein